MLTFIESISLAGDREKQNDDACGVAGGMAWVLDGATDLQDEPLTGAASDAAWIAQRANAFLHGPGPHPANEAAMRARAEQAAADAHAAYIDVAGDLPDQRWKWPTSSLLMIAENSDGVIGLDLGDSRLFVLDADERAWAVGGPPQAADNESRMVAAATAAAGGAPLLRHQGTLDLLRAQRDRHNIEGGYWVFGLDPACAARARFWRLMLERPAYLLLATDGFSALVDRYAEYSASELIRRALDKGLHKLGRELRDVEEEDARGARHPRWKRSDDATALLLRLS